MTRKSTLGNIARGFGYKRLGRIMDEEKERQRKEQPPEKKPRFRGPRDPKPDKSE